MLYAALGRLLAGHTRIVLKYVFVIQYFIAAARPEKLALRHGAAVGAGYIFACFYFFIL